MLLSMSGKAQKDTLPTGIKFVTSLTWEQLKEKALKENKYLFLDCFATWCGPCKAMDRDIYSNVNVGLFMNDRFISVKLQADSFHNGNKSVLDWYADCHSILENYNVTTFPTYLFFSPDGHIVHRGFGYLSVDKFIELGKAAVDTLQQIYTLLEKYQIGDKEYVRMPYLVNAVKSILNKNELAITIAQDYLQNYLYKKDDIELLSKENIIFIATYIQSTKERGFYLFSKYSDKIDRLTRSKLSQDIIDYLITKEEIYPSIWKDHEIIDKEPNWKLLENSIRRKYDKSYAERTILNSQLIWYRIKGDWPILATFNIKKINKYGIDTSGLGFALLNNMIWEVIFLHSNDINVINKGIEWERIILQGHPEHSPAIDTYANLLYKAGRTKEAIEWERKAAKLSPDDKEVQKALQQMQNGQPTYLDEGAFWDSNIRFKENQKENYSHKE